MGLWPLMLKRRPPWRDLMRMEDILGKNETEPKEAGGREKRQIRKRTWKCCIGKKFVTPIASRMFYVSSHARHLLSVFYTLSPSVITIL